MTESKTNEPGIEAIMQVGLGFWASKTLLSAIEMEVFTELAGHAEDLNSLQGRLGLHPRSAHDFLDALVALGFLQRANGKYSNTLATEKFLDKHKPTYVGGILEMANRRLYPFWGNLTAALRTGEPQNEGKGGGPKQRRIMELNPDHPIIQKLHERFQSNNDDATLGDAIELLFELALVAEGSEIADPVRLNRLTLDLLQKAV